MKEQLELFYKLVQAGEINPDDFYTITVDEYDAHLQGCFNSKLVKEGGYSVDSNGHLQKKIMIEGLKVTIILTE